MGDLINDKDIFIKSILAIDRIQLSIYVKYLHFLHYNKRV